ncbi:MAG: hypothetical protein AB2728_20525 [Candidatus Thiodiazotropha sp.]
MKLIIKQYLASLKERSELDALLPDLLSQMGLNVISMPGRGTRQDGVDVAAVGSLKGGPEKVYLFSIKAGDITRSAWDGDSIQSLRPSLNEIRDSYVSNRLPKEHEDKQIAICLCFGGDIQEQVRTSVEGYIEQNSTDRIAYEKWNGDKLAELIQTNFLREDLLPENSRPLLRKALALLDEPEASFGHYVQLVTSLYNVATEEHSKKLTALRQMSICLWILFAWARDNGNLEASYLSAERTLLLAWDLAKKEVDKKTKVAKGVQEAFHSVLGAYFQIADEYINRKILPHVAVLDGLSSAVRPSSSIDVNLKLFDVLGRVAMYGLWSTWSMSVAEENEYKKGLALQSKRVSDAIKSLVSNNQVLLLPIKDEQAIDIFLALFQLATNNDNERDMKLWLSEIIERARFAYEGNGPYPCTIHDYAGLLDHPRRGDEDYRKEVTEGSILYPNIALWAAILGEKKIYGKVADFKGKNLSHCNFQLWYPDDATEDNLYANMDLHGAAFSNVPVDLSAEEFLKELWEECGHTQHFQQLSSQQKGIWPLTMLACRHYRIPVPVHFTLGFRNSRKDNEHDSGRDPDD